jgi:hypothetical protein
MNGIERSQAMRISREGWLCGLSALWWLVWLMQGVVQSFVWAVQDAETAQQLQGMVLLALGSLLWLSAWSALSLARLGQALWTVHAPIVVSGLWVHAVLVEWGLPVAWFALGWGWTSATADAATMVLLMWIVRWHLSRLLAIQSQRTANRVWWAVLLLVVGLSYLYQQAGWAEDLSSLPYESRLFPGGWMVQAGESTEKALETLWTSGW